MSDGRRDSEGNLMLGSYWFKLEPTGEEVVDVILSRIAGAGKGSHSTETWDDSDDGEPSHVDLIQAAARSAATEIASLRARLEEAEKDRDNLRGMFESITDRLWLDLADIDWCDWQNEAEKRGLIVTVTTTDQEFIDEWDSDQMLVYAWSAAALEESRRG